MLTRGDFRPCRSPLAEPLQPARAESKGPLGLFVRCAVKLCAVVNGVLASCLARLFFGDPGRRWRSQPTGELRQPSADRGRIVIDDIVNSARRRQRQNGGDRRVLNVNPRPDSWSFSNDGHLSTSNLIGDGPIGVIPGPRAIEKSIAKADTFGCPVF